MEDERQRAHLGIQAHIKASFERQGLMRHLGARLGHVTIDCVRDAHSLHEDGGRGRTWQVLKRVRSLKRWRLRSRGNVLLDVRMVSKHTLVSI
jgi:hypothetical protein